MMWLIDVSYSRESERDRRKKNCHEMHTILMTHHKSAVCTSSRRKMNVMCLM